MNEAGTIQQAQLLANVEQLFADVEELKTAVHNLTEGCKLLVQMDQELTKEITKIQATLEHHNGMIELCSNRLDTAYNHREIFSHSINRIDLDIANLQADMEKLSEKIDKR